MTRYLRSNGNVIEELLGDLKHCVHIVHPVGVALVCHVDEGHLKGRIEQLKRQCFYCNEKTPYLQRNDVFRRHLLFGRDNAGNLS